MKLTIDGRVVELPDGATVLDGVNRLGLPLPQLCKDPDRPALGACRTCLVHVEGVRGTPAACHLPSRAGRWHAAGVPRTPSTWTRQVRHAPSAGRSGSLQIGRAHV